MHHGFHRDPKFPHSRLQGTVVARGEVDSQPNAVERALCPAPTEERVKEDAIHFRPAIVKSVVRRSGQARRAHGECATVPETREKRKGGTAR